MLVIFIAFLTFACVGLMLSNENAQSTEQQEPQLNQFELKSIKVTYPLD